MEMPTEMQHQAMGYDRAATMFSPDGHLLQVEYAEKTVKLGSSSIGLVCKDGVVMIADRRVRDKLIAPESANKIIEVDEHIVATAAGILSDARVLLDKAQLISQQNRVTYNSPIDPITVIRHVADNKQFVTQYGGVRPFAVSIMLAGVNKGKAHLYTTDVAGNFVAYRANAIGEHDEQMKEILRKDFNDDMNMDEGIKFVLKIFKDILGKNFDLKRFDIGCIDMKNQKLKRLHGDDLKKYSN
jgi:proteasome alpha subunit